MVQDLHFKSSPHLPVSRLISTTIVLSRVARRHGIGLDTLLQGSGLTPGDLDNPLKIISTVQELFLIRRLCTLVTTPGIGLEIGREYNFSDHGNLGLAVMCCKNWLDSLELLFSYLHLIGTYHRYDLRVRDGKTLITFHDLADFGDISRTLCEATATSIQAMSMLGNEQYREYPLYEELRFAFPKPEYASRYEAAFKCPMKFDAPAHMLILDAGLLGFSDVSSFLRAYKSWEGCTPGSYRESISEARESS